MSMDKIKISNLEVFANHGVYPEENKLGQKFVISAQLYTSLYEAGCSDALEASVNYGEVCCFIKEFTESRTYKLLESLAENLARELLLKYDRLQQVDVEIKKPWAPIGLPLESVSVEISRRRHRAYIGMGSNMGDRRAYLDGAVASLEQLKDCRVIRVADYIETAPYGGVEQDDFLNSALELETLLPAEALLKVLNAIEAEAGRTRTVRWGPRTLDLDILLYDDMIYDTPELIIPHKELHLRDFVLRSMAQIAPHVRHPLMGKTMETLLKELERE